MPLSTPRILDVGCGRNKFPNAIGIDKSLGTDADVVCDLNSFPYPFADSSFDRIYAIHVIEHVDDVIRTMEEFHRLLAPGGCLSMVTPHYTDFSSFCDPTHRSHLTSFSFRYFGPGHGGYDFYSNVRFRERRTTVKLLRLWRFLGLEFLINSSRRLRLMWEYYACYIVRGKAIEFEFEAIKGKSGE